MVWSVIRNAAACASCGVVLEIRKMIENENMEFFCSVRCMERWERLQLYTERDTMSHTEPCIEEVC